MLICKLTFFLLLCSYLNGIAQALSSHLTDKNVPYLKYIPENSAQKSTLPILLVLHGKDERGNNLELVKQHGPPRLIDQGKWPTDLPFIVISPQLPMNYDYWPVNIIDGVVDHAIAENNLKSSKIFITGFSLGGMGTWNYAIKRPERVAAIIPICGKGEPQSACNMKDIPVWAFHGENDEIIPPGGSIKMVEALQNCVSRSNDITKLTIYKNVGHDSWTPTYSNNEIYRWLLESETRPQSSDKGSIPIQNSKVNLKSLCDLPVSISESSGLQTYYNGLLWTHNDSGGQPVIYQIDTTGKIKQFITITNATNYDWEDLAKDEEGNLYIGDFGNNKNDRKSLQIYKIPNPENLESDRVKAEVIEYSYPDQKSFPPSPLNKNFDVEAMIVYNKNIYLFTKNYTVPFDGFVKLYRIPSTPGKHTAKLLDSLRLDTTNQLENIVTAADISPDKSRVALLTYNKVILLSDFEEDNFLKGSILEIPLNAMSQKEGITFKNNTEVFISDEKFKGIFGGKIYLLDISRFIQ